jgi:hypothetical protein
MDAPKMGIRVQAQMDITLQDIRVIHRNESVTNNENWPRIAFSFGGLNPPQPTTDVYVEALHRIQPGVKPGILYDFNNDAYVNRIQIEMRTMALKEDAPADTGIVGNAAATSIHRVRRDQRTIINKWPA